MTDRITSVPMALESWLDRLVCPGCGGSLAFEVFERDAHGTCEAGVLRCARCKQWYAVLRGIPRLLLPGPLRRDDPGFLTRWGDRLGDTGLPPAGNGADTAASAQVQGAFGYKWARQRQWGLEGETARLMEAWLLPRYGWPERSAYESFMRTRRHLLDAGCGLGREALRMARANRDAAVLGMDLSESVDDALAHARELGVSNVVFLQADIMRPPLKAGSFDFIMSEGVLHHTAATRDAFDALRALLAPAGHIAFYVYRRKAPLREYADDYIRELMQRLSPDEAWREMEKLTHLGKALAELKTEVTVPDDVQCLGIAAGRYDVQRLIYGTMFKCYWNDHFTFDENVLVNFDWYAPRYAWRHTEDEVRGWVAAAGLTIVHESIEESGITMRAAAPVRR